MAFLRSLQDSAFTDWFLGTDSIWTYPTVLTLHGIGMAMLVGASIVVHVRVLGVGAAMPLVRLRALSRVVWLGFAINLASGLVLFVTEAADRAVDVTFYVKLSSITLALWLGAAVRRRLMDPTDEPHAARATDRWLALSSLVLWTVAIVAGRLMAYLK